MDRVLNPRCHIQSISNNDVQTFPMHAPQVFQAVWWMGHYGSLTMKRHIAWSNCCTVNCLDLGVMAKEYQEKHFRHGAKSARTYRSKSGRKAYHGTKFLKRTGIPCQLLIMVFLCFFFNCMLLGKFWKSMCSGGPAPSKDLPSKIWKTNGPAVSPFHCQEGGSTRDRFHRTNPRWVLCVQPSGMG